MVRCFDGWMSQMLFTVVLWFRQSSVDVIRWLNSWPLSCACLSSWFVWFAYSGWRFTEVSRRETLSGGRYFRLINAAYKVESQHWAVVTIVGDVFQLAMINDILSYFNWKLRGLSTLPTKFIHRLTFSSKSVGLIESRRLPAVRTGFRDEAQRS